MNKYLSSYWIRSAFYTFLQRFSLTIFGLLNFMILIRSLSKTDMGTWALFLTVITLFETTKSGLLKNAHIKFGSDSTLANDKTIIASSSLLINGLITLTFIIIIFFFSGLLKLFPHINSNLLVMLKWFVPGLICMIYFSHFEAIQQSHFDFKGVFAGYLIRQIAFFIIIIFHFFFRIPFTVTHLAIYQSASVLLGTIIIYLYSRKYLLFRFDPTVVWIKKITGYGGYIFGTNMISSIYTNVDQFMMSTFSLSSVAYYNAATRINNFVEIPSFAAAEILFPKVSKASSEEGTHKVRYLYERMVAVLLSFTIPIGILIILFPKLVILIVAGKHYLDAAPILQLYIIVSMMSPIQNQAANVLNSIGKPGLCFSLNFITLMVKLVITYICIVNIGFYGAAVGTFFAAILTFATWYFIMRREIGTNLVNIYKNMKDVYRNIFLQSRRMLLKIRNI